MDSFSIAGVFGQYRDVTQNNEGQVLRN